MASPRRYSTRVRRSRRSVAGGGPAPQARAKQMQLPRVRAFAYAFRRRPSCEKGDALICPQCLSDQCHRSKRQWLRDYLIGLSGLRPWRCRICKLRFFAGVVPVSFAFYAHCSLCGNFNLQRISRNHVFEGWSAGLFRLLRFPAYRCAPCRNRFVTFLPHRRIVPRPSEPLKSESAAPHS